MVFSKESFSMQKPNDNKHRRQGKIEKADGCIGRIDRRIRIIIV